MSKAKTALFSFRKKAGEITTVKGATVKAPTIRVPTVRRVKPTKPVTKPFEIERIYKRLTFNDQTLDLKIGLYVCFNCFDFSYEAGKCSFCGEQKVYQGGFEEGISMLFGPYGGGKSTLSLQLALDALANGWKVRYYDIENALRLPRIIQIYNAMGRPFPTSRLKDAFYPITRMDFEDFYREVLYVIENEQPDLLIIDPLSPILIGDFLKDREGLGKGKKGGRGYEIWGERYILAIEMQNLCIKNHSIAIVTSHLGSRLGREGENKEEVRTKDTLESNLGAPFAHQAKLHLWLGYFTDGNHVFRGMVILKHRFIKSVLSIDNVKMSDIIKYEINDRGIVSA
jgi:hypothetical protein